MMCTSLDAQVCFSTQLNASTQAFGWGSIVKRLGGEICAAEGAVNLHVLIDHSAIEIFTGCGQALATRYTQRHAQLSSAYLSCTYTCDCFYCGIIQLEHALQYSRHRAAIAGFLGLQ